MFPPDVQAKKIKTFNDSRGSIEICYEGAKKRLRLKFFLTKEFLEVCIISNIQTHKKSYTVISGSIVDFLIDMRKGEKTFGKIYYKKISVKNEEIFIIHEYYAHGFLALSDTIFQYLTLGKYCPRAEVCISLPKDYLTKFRINVREIIWSEKDRNAISYEEYFK